MVCLVVWENFDIGNSSQRIWQNVADRHEVCWGLMCVVICGMCPSGKASEDFDFVWLDPPLHTAATEGVMHLFDQSW